MRIKYKNYMGEQEKSVEMYIIEKLSGQDHENGALENLEGTVDKCHSFIALLVDLLATKKVLSIKDIRQMTKEFYT